MFGNPETTTGGNALKFYASQRLEIRKGEKIEENKEQIGYYAKVKVVKNKVAPPFKTCTIPVLFAQGFDRATDLIEAAILLELVTRAGAFYTIGDKKVQGKDNLVKALGEDETMRADLEHQVVMAIKEMRMGKKAVPVTPTEHDDEDSEMMEDIDLD